MRRFVAASFVFAIAAPVLACAHKGSTPPEEPASEDGAQMARLRHENAALEDKVRNLEERLRFFERSGAAAEDDADRDRGGNRQLPVVRLEPNADEIHEPVHMREAVSLSPLPHSSPYAIQDDIQDDIQEEDADDSAYASWEPAPAPAPAPAAAIEASDGGDDVRSFRLVGTRLVDLTRQKRPPAPPKRPRRSDRKKQTGIVAQYDAAMDVYKEGRFADAEDAFETFVRSYPGHDYADNALYWKGEAAYDQAHYADALAAFTEVVERYGGGNKAPDALLKIGLCYGKLGDAANAKDVLTQLIAAYPEARATQIAHSKLAEF